LFIIETILHIIQLNFVQWYKNHRIFYVLPTGETNGDSPRDSGRTAPEQNPMISRRPLTVSAGQQTSIQVSTDTL